MLIENKAILSTFMEVIASFNMHEHQQFSLQSDPEARVCISGINEVFYNSICIKNPQNIAQFIEEIQSIHSDLKKPLTIWITAETNAPELADILNQKFESPGPHHAMLLEINKAKLTPCPENITIEQVTKPEQAYAYGKMLSEIFHLPNLQNPMTEWVINQYESSKPVCLNYMAKIDGKLAGTSALAIDRSFSAFNAGGLYNGGVLPEFRHQGIGTAMANHRLHMAREMGLEYLSILLMSDAMAKGYCERLGFESYQTMTPWFIY